MTTTKIIINLLFLVLGGVLYGIYTYRQIRYGKFKDKQGSNYRELFRIALYVPMMLLPVMNLTEEWLSPALKNEIALFFAQISIGIVLAMTVGLIARKIALHYKSEA